MAALTFSSASSRQVERLVVRFASRFPAAIARALNRAATSTRAVMAREIVTDTGGLRIGEIKDQIRLAKATPDRLVARLSVSGKRVPLIKFGASGPRPSRGRGRGVKSRLRGGAGRLPHAFFATVGHGRHEGIFERDLRRGASARRSVGAWSKNLPIHEKYGPSLPRVFTKVTPAGLVAGEAALLKNLRSELRYALGGAGQLITE
ncbi:MAG: phage tail protein [Vicinamibacterales bacterium]